MRRVVLYFHMSLDNVVSDPDKWISMDDNILKSAIEYYDSLDTVIFGSRLYPAMADYWKNAEKNPTSEREREFAQKINKIKKLVLSRSSNVDLAWNNSELIKFGDIITLSEFLNTEKQKNGKNLSVESGTGLWKVFLENEMFDELFLTIHPVIAGKGEQIFATVPHKYELNLKRCKKFDNGAVELHYEKIN